ncbi:NADPH:quinone reductase-like Zn-dependent oxidoreductase [Curtobacterium sp. PhB142]|uniref:NADP-dependent oxidoreductase n=1 Tax=unclassified Curtobacterium TaxID=257496 RepID=UPI001050FFFB|nr:MULTISPECIES: NADP-dependent oxidoreductase [unclassified Curtobacterium]TCL80233.1 NADPH:quinone reductase-like Zn-dependent oxidoreductase [Curtobacterium sp. PhB142]TCL99706.1 NADPH:quinone reductase-like Zn-dependent oxidoreductase [Curtobacterium sp. PhB134]
MRRLQYHRYGGPDVLVLEDAAIPRPGRRQILVRVRAASANAMDWKIRNGEMRVMTGRRFPRGVGHEFAGVVEQVGEGVTRFRAGDAVLGAARLQHAGAFAEFVIADERSVARKPGALSFEHAATLPVAGLTAYQAVTAAGKLRPGQRIFINGCLGGVGRIAVQVALAAGATVAGSRRSGTEAEAHHLGVDPVVTFDTFDTFDTDPVPRTGRFDVLFDTAGTLPYDVARQMLTLHGRIIDIVPSASKFARSILPGPYNAFMGRPDSDDLQHVADAAGRGDIVTRIARAVALDDAIPALAELETASTSGGGKLVITID